MSPDDGPYDHNPAYPAPHLTNCEQEPIHIPARSSLTGGGRRATRTGAS